jgi:PAT family beta-lactamase induction signal transducer AmpG
MKTYRLVYMTLDTLVIVAFIAVAMAICAKEIAATQFAIFMALGNVGYTAGSAAFGPLHAALSSYEAIFYVFAGVTVTAIIVMGRVSIGDHTKEQQRLRAEGPGSISGKPSEQSE